MFFTSSFSKDKYLKAVLGGGLNNMKMMLLQACRIAAKENYIIIEPFLGPFIKPEDKPILFSEIYDFNYFREKMKKYCEIIPYTEKYKPDLVKSTPELFWAEMEIENTKRIRNVPYLDELELDYYRALRLTDYYINIVNQMEKIMGTDYVAVHLRIENDWIEYAQNVQREQPWGLIYVSKEKILEKYKNSELKDFKKVYLATFYDGPDLLQSWRDCGYTPFTKSEGLKLLNYHTQSAIDFELCTRARSFIGNNESSFSNLVTHMRYLFAKGPSYAYNSKDGFLHLRTDFGLQLYPFINKFEVHT